jgi:hypothetical protein
LPDLFPQRINLLFIKSKKLGDIFGVLLLNDPFVCLLATEKVTTPVTALAINADIHSIAHAPFSIIKRLPRRKTFF